MNETDIVVVVARWQTTATALATVLTHVADLRSQSLREPGCTGYEVLQSRADTTVLTLIERYRDSRAAAAHRDSPHYRELVTERIVELLVDRQVEIFGEV